MRTEDNYPHPSSVAASAVMRGNRKRDTKPELRIRSAIHSRGLRFRKEYTVRTNSGKVRVDIAFPRMRVAVMVDGCFWHQCPDHGNLPRTNQTYWRSKLTRNVSRDAKQTAELRESGWIVLRLWEHVASEDAVREIESLLARRMTVSPRG
jgi:DNA mismatch endonuclease (patch repair protein)